MQAIMYQPELTERIPLSDGRGYVPCSPEYKAALAERNGIFRPSVEAPSSDHLRGEVRNRWFELNDLMDRMQWKGGHLGATVWFEPPGDVPHGWAILKKRGEAEGASFPGERDGQWHLDFYATATGDNGEKDRGLLYALERVGSSRKWFIEWADHREKPHDTEYLLLQCYPVDENALAAAAGVLERQVADADANSE